MVMLQMGLDVINSKHLDGQRNETGGQHSPETITGDFFFFLSPHPVPSINRHSSLLIDQFPIFNLPSSAFHRFPLLSNLHPHKIPSRHRIL